MKKLLALVLGAMMLMSMLSVASADDDELAAWGAAMKAAYGGTEITALLASHPSTDAMLQMIEEFTELTGITVNTKVLASTEMKTMQRSSSSTQTGTFDVYMVDAFTIYEYATNGWVASMADWLSDEAMTPSWYDYNDLLKAFSSGIASVDGVAYALPVAGESRFIAYRTDLFDEYNVAIPTTLDELLEVSAFFKDEVDGVYGITFRGAGGTLVGSAHMALAYCFTDDPIIDHVTGDYTVDSPESVESIQYVLDLAATAPDDIASLNHEDAAAIFAQGKSAMWFDATALAYMAEDPETSQVADTVSYFNVPDGPAGGSGAIAGWSLSVTNDAQNPDAAYAFCMYMTSREKAKEYCLLGGVPCRTSVFEDAEITAATPRNVYIFAAIEDAGRLVDRGVVYNYASPYVLTNMKFIGDAVNRAMVGEITAQEAAQEAQTAIVDAISESN